MGQREHGGKADKRVRGFQQSVNMLRVKKSRRQMIMKLRRKKSGVKTNVERSSSHGRCDDWRTRAERKRSI